LIKKYLFIPLLILCLAGIAYTVLRTTGHEFSQDQCTTCHAVTPVKGNRDSLKMVASIQSLCLRCHPTQENALSHPVEMVPSGSIVPTDLPLSWEGKMTCSTCHDIHSAPVYEFTGTWKFLRRQTTGAAFCSSCHVDGKTGAEKSSGHVQSLGTAHMKYIPSTKGLTIDKASMVCLSCHDGTMGSSNSDVKVGSWKHGTALSRYDPAGSHPIGINYRKAMRKHGGLRPVEQLNPAIKLIDGKVSCRSCHDMYAKTKNRLVVTMQGSTLCLECHDK
jgi:predicted CXXCH cytochrome family protein